MKFSYNWLQSFFERKLPKPKEIANILAMHSFEVESVKKRDRDFVLDIDILPNRAHDCLSHIGVARECSVLTNSKLQIPNPKLRENKNLKAKDFIRVEVENKEDCPRYTAKLILGVKVKSSPRWLQERLKVCGLQPINNIVDITNYVMLETGQPIHAFDLDKLEADKRGLMRKFVVVRKARRGEKIEALDNKTYILDKDILVIADQNRPIAIAGIKGGKSTGIDSETKNIIIEAANFNSNLIRKASKALKLKTDASWRFENGIDPNLIDYATERVCSLIQKTAGGKIVKGGVDIYPRKIVPKRILFRLDCAEKLLGVKIPKQEIKKIFKRLGFKIKERSARSFIVTVPTRRTDISLEEDLVEEIGRIYGYENIPGVLPLGALIPPERNDIVFWRNFVKSRLKEMGFFEVYSYSFLNAKQAEDFGFQTGNLLMLANPMSDNQKFLRPSLVPNLVGGVKKNLKLFPEIKIFEIGKTFRKIKKPELKAKKQNKNFRVREERMLSGILTRQGIGKDGFYELKGAIDALFRTLGITDVWYDSYHREPENSSFSIWHPAKSAEIKIGEVELGVLGEIHPSILLKELGMKEKLFAFEIEFDKLVKLALEEKEYQPISKYPAAVRDLSILVPEGTKVVEILNIINALGTELVRDVDIFDIYNGDEIPKGKESFSLHIIYQASNRTLSSKEVDTLHHRIIEALERNPEWEVRK
ncbi:phenylalanine--tRNA ligase subunit beta [bacterium]|nr:phenylalanine--tRNA ligase subunit beta [bacterium]